LFQSILAHAHSAAADRDPAGVAADVVAWARRARGIWHQS
jgi:hypothetical protein